MLLISIWPIFALICLGHALARSGFPGAGFWPMADRLNYFLLFPALLVSSMTGICARPARSPWLGTLCVPTVQRHPDSA
ncbi:MAG: hypothetical protein ACU0A0_09500 [Limimaricola sp.]